MVCVAITGKLYRSELMTLDDGRKMLKLVVGAPTKVYSADGSQRNISFWDVTVAGWQGENLLKMNLPRGTQLHLYGTIAEREKTTKSGEKFVKHTIYADKVIVASSREETDALRAAQYSPQEPPAPDTTPLQATPLQQVDDHDLPF